MRRLPRLALPAGDVEKHLLEAFAAVAREQRGRLERYRQERGATILLASHNMLEVERLCERVIMMKKGMIVDDGAPAALLARYGRDSLEQVFLDVSRGPTAPQEAAQ